MLEKLGWDRDKEFQPYSRRGYDPAIIVQDNKISYDVLDNLGTVSEAVISGKVWHEAETDAELPAVGDWVALETNKDTGDRVIHARLSRRTRFSRKVPGKSAAEQVIAVNVHTVAVVTDVVVDLNVRRIERYLNLITRSRAAALVIVNKSDTVSAEKLSAFVESVAAIDPKVPVRAVSAENGEGLEKLKLYFGRGKIVALVGSSGVGKSTLVNRFLNEEWQDTGDVNAFTGKGRHTTTYRRLLLLPGGGGLIDNPGIREVQMWTDENSLRESFRDIEDLATQCEFSDCKHGADRGCRIRAALEQGELSEKRYLNYLNLEEEIACLKKRQKKRKMHREKRSRRNRKVQHRNFADRRDHENREKGRVE